MAVLAEAVDDALGFADNEAGLVRTMFCSSANGNNSTFPTGTLEAARGALCGRARVGDNVTASLPTPPPPTLDDALEEMLPEGAPLGAIVLRDDPDGDAPSFGANQLSLHPVRTRRNSVTREGRTFFDASVSQTLDNSWASMDRLLLPALPGRLATRLGAPLEVEVTPGVLPNDASLIGVSWSSWRIRPALAGRLRIAAPKFATVGFPVRTEPALAGRRLSTDGGDRVTAASPMALSTSPRSVQAPSA